MIINIAELQKNQNEHFFIDETLNELSFGKDYSIDLPVKTTGELWYEDDVLMIQMESRITVSTKCARCLKSILAPIELKIEDDIPIDELLETYGAEFDVRNLLKEQIMLNMPVRFLCDPDCKGLCSVCGNDLNIQDCSCSKDGTINPQFADLANWPIETQEE